jgi:site-specific DNA recombinase
VLYESLRNENGEAEVTVVFGTLIDQVTLVPNEAELAIVPRGALATIPRPAANTKNPALLSEDGLSGALLPQEAFGCGDRI